MLKCNFTLCVLIHDRDMEEILPLGSAPLRHLLTLDHRGQLGFTSGRASGRCPSKRQPLNTLSKDVKSQDDPDVELGRAGSTKC